MFTNVVFTPVDIFETHWFQHGFITLKAPIVWSRSSMILEILLRVKTMHWSQIFWPLIWDCVLLVLWSSRIMVASWQFCWTLTHDIVQNLFEDLICNYVHLYICDMFELKFSSFDHRPLTLAIGIPIPAGFFN